MEKENSEEWEGKDRIEKKIECRKTKEKRN